MTEREWIALKGAQLEMFTIVRKAQMTARWAITMTKQVIDQAKQHRITFRRTK